LIKRSNYMPTTKKSKTKKSTKKKSELENEMSLMEDQNIENQTDSSIIDLEENKIVEEQQEELIEQPQEEKHYQSYEETPPPLHLSKLTLLPIEELTQLAIQMGVDDVTGKKTKHYLFYHAKTITKKWNCLCIGCFR